MSTERKALRIRELEDRPILESLERQWRRSKRTGEFNNKELVFGLHKGVARPLVGSSDERGAADPVIHLNLDRHGSHFFIQLVQDETLQKTYLSKRRTLLGYPFMFTATFTSNGCRPTNSCL
jgi:hypothetical protein